MASPVPPNATTKPRQTKTGFAIEPDKPGFTHVTGKWWSGKYTKAVSRGNLYMQLPDDRSQPVTVDAQISYLGIYRLGKHETIPIRITGSDQAETKGYETPADEVVKGHKAPHGKGDLSFKITTNQNDMMTGTYELSEPKDHGFFILRKTTDYGEKCSVM